MDAPSASMHGLAGRLLALEAASEPATHQHAHVGVRVCEKLRVSLTRFAGADGFSALLRRAMALARADVPLLEAVGVNADCSMVGLEELAADVRSGGAEPAAVIIAHLLDLLVTFIGETLSLRLVNEAWPDASLAN